MSKPEMRLQIALIRPDEGNISDHDIPGAFDFQDIYTTAVRRATDGSRFIEIGALFGKSTAYLAQEIKNSKKDIRLDVVDAWIELDWMSEYFPGQIEDSDHLFQTFLKNLEERDLLRFLRPLRLPSDVASEIYDDGSIDFVFIDGEHTYDAVSTDIRCWYPKLKRDGIMAGHDYEFPDVNQAVHDFFGDDLDFSGASWLHLKKEMPSLALDR